MTTKLMTTKLKPTIKKLWINALRSNTYKQGIGSLHTHDNNTFCCLGVLCDIHRTKTLKKENNIWETHRQLLFRASYLDSVDILPKQVRDWAFTSDDVLLNPVISIKDLPIPILHLVEDHDSYELRYILNGISLAELNDILKLSLNQIADVIENCL